MPSASKLRERVIFMRRVLTNDGAGGTIGEPKAMFGSRACQLSPRVAAGPNAEMVIAQRLQGITLFDLWVRFDSDTRTVNPDDIAVDARDPNNIFNIRSITNVDERHRWLVMVVEQGAAVG